MNKWWGYQHVNGFYQVKRYWNQDDLNEAMESPFISRVSGPFDASDRDDAMSKLIGLWSKEYAL